MRGYLHFVLSCASLSCHCKSVAALEPGCLGHCTKPVLVSWQGDEGILWAGRAGEVSGWIRWRQGAGPGLEGIDLVANECAKSHLP